VNHMQQKLRGGPKMKAMPRRALVQSSVSAATSCGAPKAEAMPQPALVQSSVSAATSSGASSVSAATSCGAPKAKAMPQPALVQSSVSAATSSGASSGSRVMGRALGASDRERTRSPSRGRRVQRMLEDARARLSFLEVLEDVQSCAAPLVTLSGGPCPNT
jgi:hypothetical protein